MKKVLIIIGFVTVILAGFMLKTKPDSTDKQLTIGNKVTISANLANSIQERFQGYSNKPQIDYDEGLLFVFDEPNFYPFWMREMLFDLDFIFIRDHKVVYLLKNIKAPINNQGKLENAISEEPFDQLLEVRAGFIDKFNIELKDTVALK